MNANAQLDADLARRIRFVVFDVDGVMTDGGVYLGDVDGRRLEFKRYDIQDGLGILLLRWAGLRVGIITGRVSEGVALRAAELRVDDLVQDEHARKLPALRKLCEKHRIGFGEVKTLGTPRRLALARRHHKPVLHLWRDAGPPAPEPGAADRVGHGPGRRRRTYHPSPGQHSINFSRKSS